MNKTFDHLYNIGRNISFNMAWCSSNRSLNNAVCGDAAPQLKPGQILRTKDNHGRKIVLIGFDGFSNVVLYQRFVNSPNGVISSNETYEFSNLVEDITTLKITNSLSDEQITAICDTVASQLDERNPIFNEENGYLKAKYLA